MTIEELNKEVKALANEPKEIRQKKEDELLEKFFSSEENVDLVFGALAKTAVEHDK